MVLTPMTVDADNRTNDSDVVADAKGIFISVKGILISSTLFVIFIAYF
jgi:hypothetical protein